MCYLINVTIIFLTLSINIITRHPLVLQELRRCQLFKDSPLFFGFCQYIILGFYDNLSLEVYYL